MSAHSEGYPIWHQDGEVAYRRRPVLVADGATFTLVEGERTTGPFAFTDLIAHDPAGGAPTWGLKRHPGWRIGFPEGVPGDLADHLPGQQRYGGVIDRIGLWPATAAFAAVAAMVVVAFLNTPPLVARAIPASVEKRLGDVMVGDFGRKGCATPAGDAALAAMVERIDPYDPTLEVSVVRIPIVNAVTLPGGRIVLFDGLLKAARSPDEVAGVIGHEIGHVRHRDVMESLLRQIGLSVLLGGMEGHVGGYTNALLASSYSRKAESDADAFALQLMQEAKVSPAATAGFFTRLGGRAGKAERLFAYVASHPVSADRAQRFAAAVDRTATYRPTIDAQQWRALRSICSKTPKETDWRF
ncbi:M48 family metallopeptidase [Sphingomonas sp. SUN019]|uniref:M48 family metallopeptidase n=1 Tax=Sphingomonas sp. SUN019 TaxID=2937788 RepID=UPI0021640508|nr:M48 family metallopeptidase [Sphingomonas sp. SUN019]UVO50525.1 M48 family metallopeptidase [Sphingomonas sp. SUN019]